MRGRNLLAVLYLVVVIGLMIALACASAPIRKTALLNLELAKGVQRVQVTIEATYKAGEIPQTTYLGFNKAFLKCSVAGLALNQALRESDQQRALLQVSAFVGAIDTLIDTEVIKIPEPARGRIGLALEGLRSVLVAMTATLGGA